MTTPAEERGNWHVITTGAKNDAYLRIKRERRHSLPSIPVDHGLDGRDHK